MCAQRDGRVLPCIERIARVAHCVHSTRQSHAKFNVNPIAVQYGSEIDRTMHTSLPLLVFRYEYEESMLRNSVMQTNIFSNTTGCGRNVM